MAKKLVVIIVVVVVAIAIIAGAIFLLSSKDDHPTWQEQYDLGVRYLNEGNYEEAIIAFTAAIEIDPKNPNLYIGRADAYSKIGDADAARADYEKALQYDDTLDEAWIGLAETYENDGDLEKALDILRKALEKGDKPQIKAKIEELESKLATSHVHVWLDATCTEPRICSECGETEGEAVGHLWIDATCTEPRKCANCGATEGKELGHDMQPATYDFPSTCSRCGYTEGEPLVAEITWTLEGGNLTISGTGPMSNYEQEHSPWYEQRDGINTVVIKDGITKIGDYAFASCYNITSFIMPDSLTSIGKYAFESVAITDFTIPGGVKAIGEGAFAYCLGLMNVTIPDSVAEIGDGSFDGCYSLEHIYVGDGNPTYMSVDGVLFSHDMTSLFRYPSGRKDVMYEVPDGVTTIANGAFSYCQSLTNISIPNSVITIGDDAFLGSGNITSVTIPDSVESIGSGAFASCDSLGEIKVSSGNHAYLSADGVLFSVDMTILHTYPCKKMGSGFIIPHSVTEISKYAFLDCNNLTSITIPSSVVTIGDHAFDSCLGLTSVIIEEGVKFIGDCAFYWCNNLSKVSIPSTVTLIGKNAFERCGLLTDVTISDGVKIIDDYAFYYCYGLTNLTIPNSVTTIGNYAFSGCFALKSVTVSSGVSSIGVEAFSNCFALENIIVDNGNQNYVSVDGVLFSADMAKLYTYPAGKHETSYVVPDGVITISDYAFWECNDIRTLTIPRSVMSFGDNVFSWQSSLTDVYYDGSPEQWEAIEKDNRLFEPVNIRYVGSEYTFTLENGVLTIAGKGLMPDYGADEYRVLTPWFYDRQFINQLVIESGVTSIGDYAFWGLYGISEVTVPEGVTRIGGSVFTFCSSLTNVSIPDSVETIGTDVFFGCIALQEINVGARNKAYASVDGIMFSADMTSLQAYPAGKRATEYTIPNSVTRIGDYAFSWCNNLTHISIPRSVTTIGSEAFENCASLASVTIPESVTMIGYRAFGDCNVLTDIYYGGTAEQWAALAADADIPDTATIHYNNSN